MLLLLALVARARWFPSIKCINISHINSAPENSDSRKKCRFNPIYRMQCQIHLRVRSRAHSLAHTLACSHCVFQLMFNYH